jgi:hypothetical protein
LAIQHRRHETSRTPAGGGFVSSLRDGSPFEIKTHRTDLFSSSKISLQDETSISENPIRSSRRTWLKERLGLTDLQVDKMVKKFTTDSWLQHQRKRRA